MISVIKFVVETAIIFGNNKVAEGREGREDQGTYIKTIVGPTSKLHLTVLIIERKPSDI